MPKGKLHGLEEGRNAAVKTVIDKCEDFLNG